MRNRLAALVVVLALPVYAQVPARTVSGVVYDSASGFRYLGPTSVEGRVQKNGKRCASVAIYLDGVKQPGDSVPSPT